MKREFPDHPIVGVGGVVVERGRVLLVRRGREPLKGKWSIPGGMVELGEDLRRGVRREIREETGIHVKPLAVLSVLDRIVRQRGRVRYHYVIVDYACRRSSGRLRPSSDVLDARWVAPDELGRYRLRAELQQAIRSAFEFFRNRPSNRKLRGAP
jgi:8-oxo-dGTP diphosphatase